jgi:hypothetical protein
VKLSAGFLSVSALPFIALVSFFRARSVRKAAPYLNVMAYAGCCGLVALPWLVRTYVYTQNPLWPWMASTFDPSWPAHLWYVHFSPGDTWGDYLHIPVWMAFRPEKLVEIGGHSPLLLGLLPALAGLAVLRPHQRVFLGYAAAATALWIGSDVALRYGLVQTSLLGIIAAGVLAESWAMCPRAWRNASQCLLALAAVVGFIFVLFHEPMMRQQDGQLFAYKVLLGSSSAEAHAERMLPMQTTVDYLNRTYGAQARVWSTVQSNALYQKAEGIAHTWFGRHSELARLVDPNVPAKELYQGLLDLEITHLSCSEALLRDSQGNPWMNGVFTTGFLENPKYCQLEFASKGYYLFRVCRPGSPAVRQEGPNLLANPSFAAGDAGLLDWEVLGEPRLDAPSRAATGRQAVCVDAGNYVQQTLPVREGSLYRLAVRAKSHAGNSNVILDLWWLDGNGDPLWTPYFTPIRVAGDFQEVVKYHTAPLGARKVLVKLLGATPEDKTWVADIRFIRME